MACGQRLRARCQHKPCQRDDAGGSRAGSGKRSGTHRHYPAERDGTLIFQPAAGSVRAQFEWEFAEELPLTAATYQLTGNTVVQRRLFLAGLVFPLPSLFSPADDSTAVTRHLQPELLGLTLPLSVEEITYYEQAENEIHSSEDEARALARLHGLQALQNDCPDAEFVAQKVDVTTENDMLHYRVVYTIIADICT